MKKSILALTAVSLLASNFAFAHGNGHGHGNHKHHPEFRQAMSECMAQAGVEKPEFKKGEHTKAERTAQTPNTDRPTPPQNVQGKHTHPHKHTHSKPKFHMTDAQRSQVETCLTQKGFEKPQKRA